MTKTPIRTATNAAISPAARNIGDGISIGVGPAGEGGSERVMTNPDSIRPNPSSITE
jgi:hypothetical protein